MCTGSSNALYKPIVHIQASLVTEFSFGVVGGHNSFVWRFQVNTKAISAIVIEFSPIWLCITCKSSPSFTRALKHSPETGWVAGNSAI